LKTSTNKETEKRHPHPRRPPEEKATPSICPLIYLIIKTIDSDLTIIVVDFSAIKTMLNLQSNNLGGHKCMDKVKIVVLCEVKKNDSMRDYNNTTAN